MGAEHSHAVNLARILPEIIRQHNLIRGPPHRNDWKDPDLVVRDAERKVFTVRYEAVNAMLLNEFLKEHRNVQELKATVAKQEATIAALTASLKEQASQIQKVSAQLALTKPAPQLAGND